MPEPTATNPPPNTPPGLAPSRRRHLHRLIPALTRKQRVRRLARRALRFTGRMHYTMGPLRHELFHRRKGDFLGAHADCSQTCAAILHWLGVAGVTDADWTGTLARKGRKVTRPARGVFVFFGPYPHVHMGIMVKPLLSRSWHVIAFGSQSGPDENTLPGLVAYFAGRGVFGHTFRDLT